MRKTAVLFGLLLTVSLCACDIRPDSGRVYEHGEHGEEIRSDTIDAPCHIVIKVERGTRLVLEIETE